MNRYCNCIMKSSIFVSGTIPIQSLLYIFAIPRDTSLSRNWWEIHKQASMGLKINITMIIYSLSSLEVRQYGNFRWIRNVSEGAEIQLRFICILLGVYNFTWCIGLSFEKSLISRFRKQPRKTAITAISTHLLYEKCWMKNDQIQNSNCNCKRK